MFPLPLTTQDITDVGTLIPLINIYQIWITIFNKKQVYRKGKNWRYWTWLWIISQEVCRRQWRRKVLWKTCRPKIEPWSSNSQNSNYDRHIIRACPLPSCSINSRKLGLSYLIPQILHKSVFGSALKCSYQTFKRSVWPIWKANITVGSLIFYVYFIKTVGKKCIGVTWMSIHMQ